MSNPSILGVDKLITNDGLYSVLVKDMASMSSVAGYLVNVMQYGADRTGVNDSTQAVRDMLAATGGYVHFPHGFYRIDGDIELPDQDIVITGEGRGATVITYNGTGTLFSAVFSNSATSIDMRNMRVTTPNLNVGVAVYVEWPEDFEHGFVQRGNFENLSFRGVNEYDNGWHTCVHSHQGDNINFISCEFKGAGGSTTVTQEYNTRCSRGVVISGRYSPVEYRFNSCYFGSFDAGLEVADTAEGIYVDNCIFICVKIAIYWVTGYWSADWPVNPGSSASGRPLLIVSNTHINYYQYGVYTSGVVSIHIHNMLMYHNDNATQTGIALCHGNGTDIFINDVEVWGFNSTYYTDGVVFYENVTVSRVENLRLVTGATNACRYGVENRSGCSNNSFNNITRRSTGGTFVSNILINDLSSGLANIGPRGCFVYSTADQSVASGPTTIVNFGARDYDPETIWSGSGGSLVVPAGVHRIRLSGGIQMSAASAANVVECGFYLNGAASRGCGYSQATTTVGKYSYLSVQSGILLVTPGDVFTLVVRHDDGVNRTLTANRCWAQMEIFG